jgi:zinc and cadmium transporter
VSALGWIIASSILMMLIAFSGGALLALRASRGRALIVPLVAFAAGSLIGSAFFHMLPAALEKTAHDMDVWLLVITGFSTFFALEQLLHWHGHHSGGHHGRQPMTYLILLGDSLHNFIDGVTIAGAFVIDVRLGATILLATAAHEIPQEFGDIAVLLHGGWSATRALAFNVLSSVTFLAGGLLTYALSAEISMPHIVAFAAGNFLYLGATDLVPEINKLGSLRANLGSLAMFLLGVGAMYAALLLE